MPEGGPKRKRLLIAFAAVLTVAVAAVLIVVFAGDESDGPNRAHINLDAEAGSTNGIPPDERSGIPPPPVRQADLKKAAKEAGCYLQLHLDDKGHRHIPPDSLMPDYETSPPTSGPHVEPPYQQADGAYAGEPKAIDYLHSLEHGRLEIQYAADLPEEIQRELKGLYDTMYGGALLFPNNEMNYAVAATTWTNLLGCTSYEGRKTLDAIRAFGRETWGKYGGEPVSAFKFTGPTPAEPREPEPEN
ncbi:MAG TPA: DUF3105 domain-containing protein [Solirubrobacterales bacterium]|nr:DUF3105 domain-containing protein [Solirubrobacterales bacterium]